MKNVYEEVYSKYGLSGSQKVLLELTGQGRTVLEVGCATGYVTRTLKERNNCTIDAIEIDRKAAEKAMPYCRKLIVGSADDPEVMSQCNPPYDVILFGDVLEHLPNPMEVLQRFRYLLNEGGQILISLPNVAFWKVRLRLLFGRFDYEAEGILDKTHLRFFTYNNATDFVEKAGYSVKKQVPAVAFLIPYEKEIAKIPFINTIYSWFKIPIVRIFPNLFCFNFVIQAIREG